ncbi:MAG: ribonuclease Y [Candidatus Dojkabacteria bacterium]
MEIIVIAALAAVSAASGGVVYTQYKNSKQLESKLIEAAEKLGEQNESETKANEVIQRASEAEKRAEERERKLIELTKNADERLNELDKREKALEQAKLDVKRRAAKISEELEKLAGLSQKEAEAKLMQQLEQDLSKLVAKRIREAEQEANAEADERSRDIVIDAMQRSATDFVAETTSTTFEIENEDLKGKVIGKEGRNIRAFERYTGVDILMDEAPETITVSSFDPIRREVAALAIQKLLKDGRIHPGSIEGTVAHIKQDLAREIRKTGEKLAYDAGCPGLPDEIIKLLGRFKYRFSYGQNLAKHSLEMVNLGQQIASELGADVQLVKKACLLHDLGKVLTYEIEGKPHHHISGDLVRKYMNDEKLANAVEAHHDDIEAKSIEAEIVKIADAISGARPGARRDSHDDYVKRVKALEDIAKQYQAVKEAYAIHAGREVRVIVKPDQISDDDTILLANRIAKEIEDKQNYPGTVKVNVIRELRVEAEAK